MPKLPLHVVLFLCWHGLTSSLDTRTPYSPIVFPPDSPEDRLVIPPPPTSAYKINSGEAVVPPSNNDLIESRGRYRVASEAVHGVATRLHDILDPSGNRNYIVSPFSVAVVVGQLMLGAKGASQRRLRDLLSPTRASEQDADAVNFDRQLHEQLGALLQQLQVVVQTPDNYYQLRTSSGFFLQTDLHVYRSFFDNLKRLYASDIYALDFSNNPVGSFQAVNSWVSEKTGGIINNILSGPLPPTTAALLANTIYFRADWLTPFSTDLTVAGDFAVSPTKQVRVRYMRGQFDLQFAESDELRCRLVVLPYKQKDVNMYVILPDRETGDDIRSFAKKLTWRNIANLLRSTKQYTTTVVMPKMKLDNTFSLKDPIMNYRPSSQSRQVQLDRYKFNGAPSRSTIPAAAQKPLSNRNPTRSNTTVPVQQQQPQPTEFDLSGASPNANFKVEDILHRVSLEVSERGTEAAAASIGSVDYSGDVKSFKVDRPFVFFIRHEPSLVNLFYGVVVDPSAK